LEEDLLILETQYLQGNRWSEIAKKLQGRTENSVKNRWKSLTKKGVSRFPEMPDCRLYLINEIKAKLYSPENPMMFPIPPPPLDYGFLKPPSFAEVEE
jgi:hypothetical protein